MSQLDSDSGKDTETIQKALFRLQWYGIYRLGRAKQIEMENAVRLATEGLAALERVKMMLAEKAVQP